MGTRSDAYCLPYIIFVLPLNSVYILMGSQDQEMHNRWVILERLAKPGNYRILEFHGCSDEFCQSFEKPVLAFRTTKHGKIIYE